MGLDISKLGARYGPSKISVDRSQAGSYATATNDANPLYEAGLLVPPLFAVVPAWETLMCAVMDLVPAEDLPRLLHLDHDLHLHRPLVVGEDLVTETEVYRIGARRSGAELTLRVRTADTDGGVVAEQYATMFIRGLGGGESGGAEAPEHSFRASGHGEPVAESTAHIDPDQTWRYCDASGDTNPIHVDEAYAQDAGLPGIIVHGLCTMAFCGRAVVATVGDDDPSRLRRLAVRFSRPVRPDSDLTTTVWDLGRAGEGRVYGFEARSDGAVVIKDGRADIGPAGPAGPGAGGPDEAVVEA